MEENQPGSAATGGGGLGTDDTTLLEAVCLPVHFNSSFHTACHGDPQATPTRSNVPAEEPNDW